MNWNCEMSSVRGIRHEKKGLNCQDQGAVEEGELMVGVLVDGAGRTNINAEAGRRVASRLSALVRDNFEKLFHMEDEEIRFSIMVHVNDEYWKIANEKKEDYQEFASTLLVLGVDLQENRYLFLHLGDGIIIEKKNEIKILSYPQNILLPNQTILTTSDLAMRNIRIGRGKIEGQELFALLTDGNYDSYPLECGEIEHVLEKYLQCGKILTRGIDDKAIIVIRRTKDEAGECDQNRRDGEFYLEFERGRDQ